MGRKNRNKNKGKKKSVPLSLNEFSKIYGVELFEEDNILKLPIGPSGVMIPSSSSRQNDDFLQKGNWRGSNVMSGSDNLIENKADTEILLYLVYQNLIQLQLIVVIVVTFHRINLNFY